MGWHLKSVAGKKRVLLELGGNAAAIVHEDRDVAFAADRIVSSAFGYAGQVCIKTQRLYVHAPIADELVASHRGGREKNRPASARGPRDSFVSHRRKKRVARRVVGLRSEERANARLGEARKNQVSARSCSNSTGMVAETKSSTKKFSVLLSRYIGTKRSTDALKMADSTRYGLQAGLFTDSRARIDEAFDRLHVGGLIVGDTASFRVDSMPYGGVRDSGSAAKAFASRSRR